MCTGPGPQWASGGDTVVDSLGSEARGRCRVTGGTVRVKFTCTWLEAIRLKPWTEGNVHRCERLEHSTAPQVAQKNKWRLTLPTDKMLDSVTFQKDFQNCMSRFWVMRSNSAPRSSGSMTYLPDVSRERAALPGGRGF